MRTLARQAVVFALLGLLVTIVGCLAFLTKDIRTNANVPMRKLLCICVEDLLRLQ